jgi:hypothetical protein
VQQGIVTQGKIRHFSNGYINRILLLTAERVSHFCSVQTRLINREAGRVVKNSRFDSNI